MYFIYIYVVSIFLYNFSFLSLYLIYLDVFLLFQFFNIRINYDKFVGSLLEEDVLDEDNLFVLKKSKGRSQCNVK